MEKKPKTIIIILIIFILLLIPFNIVGNNSQTEIIYDIQASNQASAIGNITEAEVAIQNAYEKLLEAESLGIYTVTLSNNLQTAIVKLNLAIELNDSMTPDFDSIIGNATLAKNSANQVLTEATQLISSAIIIIIIILIVIIASISGGIYGFVRFYLKRLKKQTDEDFLESIIIKKEDKK